MLQEIDMGQRVKRACGRNQRWKQNQKSWRGARSKRRGLRSMACKCGSKIRPLEKAGSRWVARGWVTMLKLGRESGSI